MAENLAEPAGALQITPRPAIESRVLELVKLGLKVHDIAAMLNTHPRAIERMIG
jgi:DNA-binding NarL/FixJ family response regulator